MERALRPSVASKCKEEVLEKTIELAKRRGPSAVIIHNNDGAFVDELVYGDAP